MLGRPTWPPNPQPLSGSRGPSEQIQSSPRVATRVHAHQLFAKSLKLFCIRIPHQSRRPCLNLDGLYVPSTMTLAPMTVLFSAAATAFPAAPHMSTLLSHAAARALALKAGHALGWPVL